MGVAVVTINCWLAKLKNGTLSLEEDGGAGCRNANEKLNLLLEYQKVTAENEGEWLRQNQHYLSLVILPLKLFTLDSFFKIIL